MINVKQSLNLNLLLETTKPRLCGSVGCVCLVCLSHQYVVGLDVSVHAVVAWYVCAMITPNFEVALKVSSEYIWHYIYT